MKKFISVNLLILITLISAGFCFALSPPNINAADSAFTITWSSDSYVPPGYEGLALPTQGSQIKVFVLPTKKLNVDPEKLTYRWLIDGDIAGWAGGQGKSVLSFKATKWPEDYHKIESQVLDGGNVVWRGFTEIKISSAKTIFRLPNNNYSLTEILSAKTGQTLKILAVPFFFNVKSLANLNFQWKIDGQELINSDNKDFNIFSLIIPAGQLEEALTKNLGLTISDKKDADQQASSQVILEIK